MVEEETGTDMVFEEQEENSETQGIILKDLEETNLDPEVQENAPEIIEEDLDEEENASEINEVIDALKSAPQLV